MAAAAVTMALVGAPIVGVGQLPAAAAGPNRDIIFSLDGSGSIDSSDWQMQKDGYSAALGDAVAFPRDGSTAVGVNQWSGAGEVRTELPLTVIRTAADVTAIVTAIQAIVQFGQSTDPVSGLDHATQALVTSGRQGADWTICMSTDGVKNDGGGSLPASAAAAKAAGVDRYSVIGIDDGGNSNALRAFYQPDVFGGGTFTLARNTVEFAGLIVGGCLNDPVEITGIEVTQGIQNWKNTVPLVAAKSTVVRVFSQVPAGAPPQRMTARLIGRRGGVELPGSPLAAANAGGTVLVSTDIAARRAVLTDSLIFQLPASWRSGAVELEVDGAGTALSCDEAAGPTAHDCKATIDFGNGAAARLRMVGIPVSDKGTTTVPSEAALRETAERIRSVLPAATLTASFDDRLFTTLAGPNPDLALVNSRLSLQRFLDLCFSILGCSTLYYGQLSGNGGGLAAGITADVASGWDDGLATSGGTGFGRNRGPHEVGHLIGLNHSVRGAAVNGLKRGPCGEVAGGAAPDYPYFGAVGGGDRALLSPAGAAVDDEFWGLDTRFARGDVNGLAVIAPTGPAATFDLMSYCRIGAPQGRWPSDYTWKLALDGLNARFGANVSLAAAPATTTGTHLVFTGQIDSGTAKATINAPALVTGELPAPPTGPYELRLFSPGGATLAAVPFAAEDDSSDAGPGGALRENQSFVVPVIQPVTPVGRAEVWRGATKVGEVLASAHAPGVTITAPAGGSHHNGGTVHVAWTGVDADHDRLTYHARYSADGGASWKTLADGFEGTNIDVPRVKLAGESQSIIEVQATDGVHVTVARTQPVVVADGGPVVTAVSPHDGEAFYSGVQQVLLEATADDPRDGDVTFLDHLDLQRGRNNPQWFVRVDRGRPAERGQAHADGDGHRRERQPRLGVAADIGLPRRATAAAATAATVVLATRAADGYSDREPRAARIHRPVT